jgi:hypothetical protein
MLVIFALAVIVLVLIMARNKPKRNFTVYGTTWCGYTTKQREHLDQKYGRGSHTFIDCDQQDCGGINSFPVTITPSGKKIIGFNEI